MRQAMPEIVAEGPEIARGIMAEQAIARKAGQTIVDIAGREPTKSFDLPINKLYEEVIAGSIQDLGGGTRQTALNEMIAVITDFDPIKRAVKEIPDSDAIAFMRAADFQADINNAGHIRKAKAIIRKAFGEGYKASPYATSEKTILESAVEFSGKRASSALAQEPTITKAQQIGGKNISEPMDFGTATRRANQLRSGGVGEYGQTAIVSPIYGVGGAKTGKYRVIWGDLDRDAVAALTKDIDRIPATAPIYPSTTIDRLKQVILDADMMLAEGALHEAELAVKAADKGIRIERLSLRRYVASLPDGAKQTLGSKKAVAEFTALWEGQGYNVDILSALERGSITPDALGVSALGKGAELIGKGVTDFAAWSKQMAKEMGPQVQEMLKGIWEEVSPGGKFTKAESEATAAIRRNAEYMFSKGGRTKPIIIPPDPAEVGAGEPILGKMWEATGEGQFIKSGIFRGLTRQDRHFARLETQFGVPLWSEVYQPLRQVDDVVAHANLKSRYHEKLWKIMRGFTAEKHKLIPNYIDGMDLGEVQLPRMIANATKAGDMVAVAELASQQAAIRTATAGVETLFTAKDKMLLGQLDEFFKDFMAKNLTPLGIKPKKYYFPHVMRRDYSTMPFNEWLQMKSFPGPGDPEFWHKLKRFYLADDLETNAAKAGHKYIDRFYYNKYKKPVFDEVQPKVEAWKPHMDEATFTFVRNFLESARGFPGRDRPALETTMRNLFDALPEPVRVKQGPGWDRAVDNMVALMYSSGLGFSPGFMLRNLTQPLINTYPIVSTAAFAKGIVDTFANPRMWQRAKSVPGLLDRDMMSAPIDLYGDTWFQGLLSGVVQKTMSLNRMTEMIDRVASFSMGVHEVAPMIEKRLPWEQMIKRSMALRTLEVPEKKYMAELYNSGKRTEFENQFGLLVARKGNFDYSKLNRPQALQTIPGKIAGMYGTYPMNMLAGISQVMRNGTTADKIVIGTKWAAVNAALFGTFASMGIDATHWLFLSPVAYTGGQAVDVLQNVGRAVAGGPMLLANEYERIMKSKGEPYPAYLRDFRAANSQAIQAAANLRKQLPYLVTPAGGQIRRTIRAFEEPTLERGAQRVLGFAPKAESKTEPKWRRLKRRRPAGSSP